jgi:hypothetical protein
VVAKWVQGLSAAVALGTFVIAPAAGAFAAGTASNTPPDQPIALTISDCNVRCTSPAVVRVTDPALGTVVTDADGGPITVTFEVRDSAGAVVRTGDVVHSPDASSPARWRIEPKLPSDGRYRWRARACDDAACGPRSAWFTFTVDTDAAVPEPTVKPVDPKTYFEYDGSGRSSGGVGIPGQLKLAANGERDLAEYVWSLDAGAATTVAPPRLGGAVVITVTPESDLLRQLSVYSLDVAGHRSPTRIYRFLVTPPEPEAGHWLLDETGTDPVARDVLERNPGISSGGVTRVAGRHQQAGNAAHFGAPSSISTARPVLATERMFSVTAWVRLTDSAADHVAVSQRGTTGSNFELGYLADERNLCFTITTAEGVDAPLARACTRGAVKFGEWVHLAAVFDPFKRQIRLYVDGGSNLIGETAVQNVAGSLRSAGPMTIGSAWQTRHWLGDIDDVTAYQRVLSEAEISSQALDR